MFNSVALLQAHYPNDAAFARPLQPNDMLNLGVAIEADAAWSYRSALMSFVSASELVARGYRSWPVVHSYYSLFYSLRCMLFSAGVVTYYIGKKPVRINCTVGATPSRLTGQGAGNSHISAGIVFRNTFPNHDLTQQQIELEIPFDWLRSKRESVNYNDQQMNREDHLQFFERFSNAGFRTSISEYMNNIDLYAFQPREAVMALPAFAILSAKAVLRAGSADIARPLVVDELKRLRDKNGAIRSCDAFIP